MNRLPAIRFNQTAHFLAASALERQDRQALKIRHRHSRALPPLQYSGPSGNGSVARLIQPTDEPAKNCRQPALAEGAKELEDRHEASPAVAAAVKKGSLAEPCCMYSFSAREDWMTSLITSANDSSH